MSLPWVKPDDLNGFREITETSERIPHSSMRSANVIPKGSILVCGIGSIGKIGVAGCDLVTNQQINAFIFREALVRSRYGRYALFAASHEFVRTSNKVVIGITNKSSMGNVRIPVPPVGEQTTISDFLDQEIAKIDGLIAKQTEFLTLLDEHRRALVTNAVIRGLEPLVIRENSGYGWLGAIPSHWHIEPIRAFAKMGRDSFVDGDWIESPYITDSGIRLIQTGNVGVGIYKEQGFRYISDKTFKDLRCTEVFPENILICRLGPVVIRDADCAAVLILAICPMNRLFVASCGG